MKWRAALACAIGLGASMSARGGGEIFDRIDDAFTRSSEDGRVRARVSGLLDLEGYAFAQPPPGLIVSSGHELFQPRLSLFLDLQLGEHVYGFVQGRVDRGFDPTNGALEARLDEYALRITPWNDGRFNLQVGKFATVVGNWVHRHGSWDNPFVTAPLPYENLTGMWDVAAVRNAATLLRWAHVEPKTFAGQEFADSHFRLPIIWGPSYASGAAVSGEIAKFDYAAEIKNGSLSSRPAYWGAEDVNWDYPTYSARIGYRPDERWRMGVSASEGSYLLPAARSTLAPGQSLQGYKEIVVGEDLSFAWHHWQAWAEAFQCRFEIPGVGDVETSAYYVEAKYKFTPQFSGAMRWGEERFGDVRDAALGNRPWGYDTWRLDLAPSYRFSPNVQVKLQYSLEPRHRMGRGHEHSLAAQVTVRF